MPDQKADIDRLRRDVDFLQKEVSALRGRSGPVKFIAPLLLPNDSVPTDDLAVLSKGAADALYGGGSSTPGAGAADNSVLQAFGSAQTLTGSAVDVSGASISLDRTGKWFVFCVFTFARVGVLDANASFFGYLVAPTGTFQMVNHLGGADDVTTCSSFRVVTVASAPATAKLQIQKGSGTGTSQTGDPTGIAAIWVSD